MDSHEKQNLFMASISHELRTPLTSILGYGELLSDTQLDNKQREYLNRMLHSSKYLLSLVGDFIDIVKIEKNDIKLEEKEIRLHAILMECADVIKANLDHNVLLDIKIPFLDYTILADERRIKQIILNILSNAAKFTHNGSIKFHLINTVETEHHIKIKIKIEDTGIGMSAETQKVLFSPFTTSDSTQGFGLGLFISQEIIKLMDGQIYLTSKKDVGSTFIISFVVKKGEKKIDKQILAQTNILMFSTNKTLTLSLKQQLEAFKATLYSYDTNQDLSHISKYFLEHTTQYDLLLFDITSIPKQVHEIISIIKLIQPNIKCIGLIEPYRNLSISNFDKLIELPSTSMEIVFELEAFLANNPVSQSSFMDFSHLKVLIVEDVEMSYEYIKEMLAVSFSIHCDHVDNGKKAIEKVRHNTYDIIFMDIRMPVMNGYEASKEIRKFNNTVPIICMSADVYEKNRTEAKAAGMNNFITKPIEKNEIKQIFLDINSGIVKETTSKISIKKEKPKEYPSTIVTHDPTELKNKAYTHLSNIFNDEITITTLMTKAVESIEKYLNSIQRNKIEKNTDALVEDMHAIKGVLANLGLKEPSTIAGEIQKFFQKGELQKAYKIKNIFLQDIDSFVKELKKELK